MAKLFSRIALLVILVLATYLLIILTVHFGGSTRPLSVIADKEARLRATASPKLVFIGGSNIAFGIDSALAEQQMGIPVVNMGLHGGLGLRFMLNEVKPFLRSGDTVVISPEYESFFGLLNGDETIFDVLYLYPDAIRSVEPYQMIGLLPRLPASIQVQFEGLTTNLLSKPSGITYTRDEFNRYGDEIGHLSKQSTVDLTQKRIFNASAMHFDSQSVQVLAEFSSYARARGASVWISFPPIPETEYARGADEIELVCRSLTQSMPLAVLDLPSDRTYPLEYFFDTLYHLDARGIALRTAGIVKALGDVRHGNRPALNCAGGPRVGIN